MRKLWLYIYESRRASKSKRRKKRYDLHKNTIKDKGYVKFLTSFIDHAVTPYVSKGKDALDFGSGPNPVLSEILTSKYNYNCKTYDLYYNPNKDYDKFCYDLITATEVFEHLKNPKDVFNILTSLLKKDGLLAIMTEFVPISKNDFENWYYLRDPTHISFFTPKAMEILAEDNNLKIVYCDNKSYTSFK